MVSFLHSSLHLENLYLSVDTSSYYFLHFLHCRGISTWPFIEIIGVNHLLQKAVRWDMFYKKCFKMAPANHAVQPCQCLPGVESSSRFSDRWLHLIAKLAQSTCWRVILRPKILTYVLLLKPWLICNPIYFLTFLIRYISPGVLFRSTPWYPHTVLQVRACSTDCKEFFCHLFFFFFIMFLVPPQIRTSSINLYFLTRHRLLPWT